MKKVTLLGLVIVLLAFSAIPVMAAGPNNGHGNGVGTGQNTGTGDQDQTRQQDKDQTRNHGRGKFSNNGIVGKSNKTGIGMRMPFYLQGTITAIDTTNYTLTISVNHGNARVKQFIGAEDIHVNAADTQRIFKNTQGDESEGTASTAPSASLNDDEGPASKFPIDFKELRVGDIVAVHGIVVRGNVVGDIYKATMITVYVKGLGGLPESEP